MNRFAFSFLVGCCCCFIALQFHQISLVLAIKDDELLSPDIKSFFMGNSNFEDIADQSDPNFYYKPKDLSLDDLYRDGQENVEFESDANKLKFTVYSKRDVDLFDEGNEEDEELSRQKRQTIEANRILLKSQPLKQTLASAKLNNVKMSLNSIKLNSKLATANSNSSSANLLDSCHYTAIKSKISSCFQNSNDCNSMLECVVSLNMVSQCKKINRLTPSVWIARVYEILYEHSFCSIRVECKTNENEHLRILDRIMRSSFEYGPVFLNKPKTDNKVYCSKSHVLVSHVKEIFDTLDNCFEDNDLEIIMNSIDQSSISILDPECSYCISGKFLLDNCILDTCNDSFNCIYENTRTHKCNIDHDQTTLTLLTSFLRNISHICLPVSTTANDTDMKNIAMVNWLRNVDDCIASKSYLGLTIFQAPPHINFCDQMEQTFKCIHRSLHKYDGLKKRVRPQFNKFAQQYTRMQRLCDTMSLAASTKRMPQPKSKNLVTRHPFQNSSEQTVLEDDKSYYHQTVVRAELDQQIHWVNLDAQAKFKGHVIKTDQDLSKNYLKATIVKLKFKFPYYGHLLDQIVVATGGFIYVGSLMNPLITKAQYIAPLMANFDPTLSNRTSIKYVDNSTHFICTWENLILQDQPENGEYTFQVILNDQGVIVFNYKKVPTTKISNINHTVKIGLSDAYIFYKILSTSKIEYTIVQYHVVNVKLDNVKTGNSLMFFMLKNCLQLKSCDTCLKSVGKFKCLWCPTLQRCSDTMDRYRQEWLESSCPVDLNLQNSSLTCSRMRISHESALSSSASDSSNESDYVKSVVLGLFMTVTIAMVATLVGWSVYAYKNPTSPSGIWLIEHRPTRVARILMSFLDKKGEENNRFQNPVA